MSKFLSMVFEILLSALIAFCLIQVILGRNGGGFFGFFSQVGDGGIELDGQAQIQTAEHTREICGQSVPKVVYLGDSFSIFKPYCFCRYFRLEQGEQSFFYEETAEGNGWVDAHGAKHSFQIRLMEVSDRNGEKVVTRGRIDEADTEDPACKVLCWDNDRMEQEVLFLQEGCYRFLCCVIDEYGNRSYSEIEIPVCQKEGE